ncbi:hypothetical protein PIB30_093872 [Stylosanthes scabra]|uniref:Uncharacterized protein n=1 Tax=Stylosanthes scabra TaxID=79078 RepID=A0ABU6XVZ7_9FABA|nr:hypothetical protein [Stylosanthes scabra]
METQLSTIADLVTRLTTQLSHNNPSTSQPPIDISHEDEEAFEKVDEQEIEVEMQACEEVDDNEQEMKVEEAYKELGFTEQESNGVEITLTHPLGTSLTNLSSNTPFEWDQGRCKAQLKGFQAKIWSLWENLDSWSLQGKYDDEQENGWTQKVWNPGIHFNNQQFWRVLACYKSFLGLLHMICDPGDHCNNKH